MRTEIRIAGNGGQGILLAGVILGKAASIYDNKYATQTQSYGPEARGGASKTEVIIDDEDISYPYVYRSDVFIALSQQSYDAYSENVKNDSIIIIDPTYVKNNDCRTIKVTATCAAKALGTELAANMVMLGALSEVTKTVSIEALEKSMRDSTAPQFHDINTKALVEGALLAREYIDGVKKGSECQASVNSI